MTSQPSDSNPLALASEALADAVESVGRSVVAVHASRHDPASGVLWQPGVVVTTARTTRREDGIRVTLPDGTSADATLAGADAGTDLAVLRIGGAPSTGADIGDAAQVRTGHFVFAVARGADGAIAASFGIVGATGGEWRSWRGGRIDRLIRLDGGLYAGYSGGPVADAHGKIVGIGTSALSRSFGIVIPASTVARVAEALLATGRVARGYLGAGLHPVALQESVVSKLALGQPEGLIVLALASQGPADRAGVLVGDILLDIDGHALRTVGDLHGALGRSRVGAPARVKLVRAGALVDAEVTIGERPQRRC